MLIREQEKIDFLSKTSDSELMAKLSDAELTEIYKYSEDLRSFFGRMQIVTKELCNSVYGGFGTNSLRYFNQAVASDITAEGRWSCILMERVAQKYFKDTWPKDTAFHDKLKTEFPDLFSAQTVAQSIEKDIAVYADTDSCSIESIITTERYGRLTIGELFDKSEVVYTAENGAEHRLPDTRVINWSKTKGLHFANPKTIIRHKTNKPKWVLKTKSGKSISITNDHSLIVFRDGIKLSMKASEVNITTDKILSIYEI